MITDDPGTVEKGHFEINSGITVEHIASESLYEFPFIDINYGVSGRQHINIEVPLVSKYVKGNGKEIGVGKVGIGTKFRFVDKDKAGIDISTHPAVSFNVSSDAVDKGIVENGIELFIPLEFQKEFNKNILGVEIGGLVNSINQGAWSYGLLYARTFNSKVNAAVELNGSTNLYFSATTLLLNLGIRMTITQRCTIQFSGGKSIVLPEFLKPVYIGYLALQFAI